MHAPVRYAAVNRRNALCWLGGLLTAPMAVSHAYAKAPASDDLRLAAAWQQADGSYRIGVLAAGRSASGAPLRVIDALEVPTRAHGVHALPDGSIVATARRPGDWLVRWHPGRADPAVWHWVDATRSFNGHVIASPDGRTLYTTETDIDTGASLVARRDARSLETEAEWPTHGIDAHELIWAPPASGSSATRRTTLIVANGGVPTAPETGRVKRDLHTMDSSIVRLDGSSGELQGQWRLQDKRLSLRHLAWNADRTVLGIALQAEHDEAAIKHSAPILALFDGGQQAWTTRCRTPCSSRQTRRARTHMPRTSRAPAWTTTGPSPADR
ncbi:MAG: DUF1513 domain-containing protein [Comamonadaceae bacterium]|nr:MAG: DUF1513 domain-containing protein [Comamonadaceae bacterium]